MRSPAKLVDENRGWLEPDALAGYEDRLSDGTLLMLGDCLPYAGEEPVNRVWRSRDNGANRQYEVIRARWPESFHRPTGTALPMRI